MNCINCGNETLGEFCSHCGQKSTVKRLSFREGWNDFWGRVYGLDGMLPRTLRDLTVRPGEVSHRYIEGNRKRYYGPVGYFFLMITLVYLISSLLGIDMLEFLKSRTEMLAESPHEVQDDEFMKHSFETISANMKILSFLMIGLQALVSRYLFFRKSGYSLIEHTVLPFYAQGHLYWLTIISILLYTVWETLMPSWISLPATALFTSFAYSNFFHYQSKSKVFFKGLGRFSSYPICFWNGGGRDSYALLRCAEIICPF